MARSIATQGPSNPILGPAIVREAARLGVDPVALATAIGYETIGTYSTDIRGGAGNRYYGLIQFGPAEQRKYGIEPGMSADEQMVKVGQFLQDRGLQPGSGLLDIYSTINAGSPGHYGARDASGLSVRQHVAIMQKKYGEQAAQIVAATPDEVASRQAFLKAQGFNPGPIDGIDGPQTQAAMVAYRQSAAPDTALAYASGAPMPAAQAASAMASGQAPAVPTTVADITAPPTALPASSVGADRVVQASIEGDPAHLTNAWNSLVGNIMAGGAGAMNEAKQYFAGVSQPAKTASAASMAYNPDLWKSVPSLARAQLQSASDDILTGGHAAEQMKSLGIGPAAGPARFPSSDDMATLGLTPQERNLYQHHLDNLSNGKAVINPDGSTSTIFQMGVTRDGRDYNIPTVWDGKILNSHDAMQKALGEGRGWNYWPSYPASDTTNARMGSFNEAEYRYGQMHDAMEKDVAPQDDQIPTSSPAEKPSIYKPVWTPSPDRFGEYQRALNDAKPESAGLTVPPMDMTGTGAFTVRPANMATSEPASGLDESMSYAMGETPDVTFPLHLDAPTAVEKVSYTPPAPTAPPPPKQATPMSMATTPPKYVSGQGRLGRLYNAIAAPIRPGSSSFWDGPMVQPSYFLPGGGINPSGGASMPYQRNVTDASGNQRTQPDQYGNKVNVGVYTDNNGNQHQYTWSTNGAP